MKRIWFALTMMVFAGLGPVEAQENNPNRPGQVQLPLEIYTQLIQQAQAPDDPHAPVNFALGNARVNVNVGSTEPGRERGSLGHALDPNLRGRVGSRSRAPRRNSGDPGDDPRFAGSVGRGRQEDSRGARTKRALTRCSSCIAWMRLRPKAATSSVCPLPEAASINLSANLPGTGLDVAVIPAAGVRATPSGATTRINTTIPTTRGVQISWRTPSKRGASFSRAHYRAALSGNAIVWRGEFRVELFADETATLHLLPRKVTLTNPQVDGKEASILVDGKHFATLVKGRGVHTVVATFQTPVARADGPPRVELVIPKVPVSRFELTLPGRKELSAQPGTNVTSRTRANTTVATVHVPLTDQVTLTWSESVPDVVRRELRANASLYHVIYAEEGVLFSRARGAL